MINILNLQSADYVPSINNRYNNFSRLYRYSFSYFSFFGGFLELCAVIYDGFFKNDSFLA